MRAGCSRVTHPCAGRRQKYCYPRAAPRLACVRPAASVHPEPGSNSSLYISISLSSILGLRFLLRNQRSRICFRYFACTASSSLVNELPMSLRRLSPASFFSRPGASLVPLFPNGIAKVLLFPEPPNFSALFFHIFSPAQNRRGNPRGADAGTMVWMTGESGARRTDPPRRDFFRGEERA